MPPVVNPADRVTSELQKVIEQLQRMIEWARVQDERTTNIETNFRMLIRGLAKERGIDLKDS